MEKYTVYLDAMMYATAVVEVEADSAETAETLAIERARRGDVTWQTSMDEVDPNSIKVADL